ncbi:MAG: hypothetical protein D6722_20830, partial [Bacteroidetes bacterium]
MIRRLACMCLLGISWLGPLLAQPVYISKYAPGRPGAAPQRIELFNESETQTVDLSGYCLLTRTFGLRLPEGVQIGPLQALRMGRGGGKGLDLDMVPFLEPLRAPASGLDEGDFVV